jgi:peptide-methionine (S)-S-oxide reductase
MKRAVFGAGCFWGVEAGFRKVKGVMETQVGYMGGWVEEPSYPEVCGGETGHTEVVEVVFDESVVSYGELVEAFYGLHDGGGRQKRQYRSVLFVDEEQEGEAQRLRRGVTDVERVGKFWRAEEYHQNYLG